MDGVRFDGTAGRNPGVLILRPDAGTGDEVGLTAIVSGVGRSGTSMAARVLDRLGVPMGPTEGLAVHEDREFLHALVTFDFMLMQRLIEVRNASLTRWGFKFPSLQNHLMPPQLLRFRRPHLIVVMRDPVAVASRAFMSDGRGQSEEAVVANAMTQTGDLLKLVLRAECPTLLVSYEKAIAAPGAFVDALAAFCGVAAGETVRRAAVAEIVPNHPGYIGLFHAAYRGHLDAVEDGWAVGWCKRAAGEAPVEVELLADGVVVSEGWADGFREDLAAAGIGDYAFRLPVIGLGLTDDAVIAVQARGSAAVLEGSGRVLGDLARV